MIDGTVARRMGNATEFGARLDTVSDFVFMTVALKKIELKSYDSALFFVHFIQNAGLSDKT